MSEQPPDKNIVIVVNVLLSAGAFMSLADVFGVRAALGLLLLAIYTRSPSVLRTEES